jgi:hypothetical protein
MSAWIYGHTIQSWWAVWMYCRAQPAVELSAAGWCTH